MNRLVMISDIGLRLGYFLLFRLGFVLDYEIFLEMHPAILDTLEDIQLQRNYILGTWDCQTLDTHTTMCVAQDTS